MLRDKKSLISNWCNPNGGYGICNIL